MHVFEIKNKKRRGIGVIPNVIIMGSDPRECHASTRLYLTLCKCTFSLYTRFCATVLNGYFSGSSYVSKPTIALHTHSHAENITITFVRNILYWNGQN